MDMLDEDTATLAAMLQVDRQCFFAAVPRLYRDPFFRIREIYRRKCHSIRINLQRTEADQRLRPITSDPSLPLTEDEETALKVWNAYRTKAFFEQDDVAINMHWRQEAQDRERRLLLTLMSTLVQDLCIRFPAIADWFLPLPSSLASSSSTSTPSTPTMTATIGTLPHLLRRQPLDLGPHFREVTWTSQHYLRHWAVIDLEKLSTRRRHLPYTSYEAYANGGSKDKDGLFNFMFRGDQAQWWMIGVPEYLQRALLNRPGADRILALRIPIRRVRSFQERRDRAPRNWIKSKSSRRRKGEARAGREMGSEEEDDDDDEEDDDEEEEGCGSLEAVTVMSSTGAATTMARPPQPLESFLQKSKVNASNLGDESSRPYCFTLNKLTNLRRVEICNLSQNKCDWETLRRALFTLEFGDDSGVQLKDLGKIKVTPELLKKRRHNNKIRELCLTTQSTMGPEIDGILECFGGLEVLEIMTHSFQDHPWVTNWDPSLCKELKVLRVGEVARMTASKGSLEDLGRFCRLEELRLRIDFANVFQWVVDAKKEIKARAARGSGVEEVSSPPLSPTSVRERAGAGGAREEEDPLSRCLPRLKKLGVLNRQNLSLDVLTTVAEAFGDQLDELVICFSGHEGPLQFKRPLTHLTRLAIRFTNIKRFNFEGLAQQCPMLEWIIIQHTWFTGSHPDHDVNGEGSNPTAVSSEARPMYDRLNDAMVEALGQFTRLRTFYIEGHSTMRGDQLRNLVDRCSSLRRIGVHMMPAVTTEELAEIDCELRDRPEKFPLLQRGVYRLPSRMSNYLDLDFHWRVIQWGYDLHE
ncbi:hypothetical protein BGZ97_012544 [Linnemannia gamsii]|uniref:RNI-like protein n=1 Tax=Linnemannia gamsii TaxID=64522 RepID=A0A9P6R0X9_9FUNG|nr:hypothetical protein BGZ97_012544 [Linnemannia gamsii]